MSRCSIEADDTVASLLEDEQIADAAALLVNEVLPYRPFRQSGLSVPFALRFLFARQPEALTSALGTVVRAISAYLIARAGLTRAQARTGAVTLIQPFGFAPMGFRKVCKVET